jgi:hypothetical protein
LTHAAVSKEFFECSGGFRGDDDSGHSLEGQIRQRDLTRGDARLAEIVERALVRLRHLRLCSLLRGDEPDPELRRRTHRRR